MCASVVFMMVLEINAPQNHTTPPSAPLPTPIFSLHFPSSHLISSIPPSFCALLHSLSPLSFICPYPSFLPFPLCPLNFPLSPSLPLFLSLSLLLSLSLCCTLPQCSPIPKSPTTQKPPQDYVIYKKHSPMEAAP